MGRIENNLTEKFNKDSYVIIENFIDLDYIKWAKRYFSHKFNIIEDYKKAKIETTTVKQGKYYYGSTLSEVLLFSILPKIEDVVEKSLYPTYSFARLYEEGQNLIKHTDRPACEYSISLPLNYTGWPLIVEDKEIYLSPGGAIVYKGRELKHWRNPLPEGYQLQLHLHYVDKNGEFKDWKYDKRSKYLQHPFLQ